MFKSISNSTPKALALLSIFYVVGIFGLSMPEYKALFVSLTPLNLMLTAVVFILANKDFSTKFFALFSIIFLIGYFVELVGVKTEMLFGSYYYGNALGTKLFDIPLIIGANWFILSFSTHSIAHRTTNNLLLSSILGATLMTALDWLIEPVAVKLDFWHWQNDQIPLQNFVMWFVVSFAIHFIINQMKVKPDFKLGLGIYLIQVVFFILLNLTLK